MKTEEEFAYIEKRRLVVNFKELGPHREEQILLVFICHNIEMKRTLSEATKTSSNNLQEVWRKVNIPVKTEENIRAVIQKLRKLWQIFFLISLIFIFFFKCKKEDKS